MRPFFFHSWVASERASSNSSNRICTTRSSSRCLAGGKWSTSVRIFCWFPVPQGGRESAFAASAPPPLLKRESDHRAHPCTTANPHDGWREPPVRRATVDGMDSPCSGLGTRLDLFQTAERQPIGNRQGRIATVRLSRLRSRCQAVAEISSDLALFPAPCVPPTEFRPLPWQRKCLSRRQRAGRTGDCP